MLVFGYNFRSADQYISKLNEFVRKIAHLSDFLLKGASEWIIDEFLCELS